jgi:hypothetical protein
MAEDQNASKETKEKSKELKTLAFQGAIGAIALAGSTAIPLAITRILQPQTTVPQPLQVAPAQISPVNTNNQLQNPANNSDSQSNQTLLQNQVKKEELKKGKKKD